MIAQRTQTPARCGDVLALSFIALEVAVVLWSCARGTTAQPSEEISVETDLGLVVSEKSHTVHVTALLKQAPPPQPTPTALPGTTLNCDQVGTSCFSLCRSYSSLLRTALLPILSSELSLQ